MVDQRRNMGNVHINRGRLAPALILVALVALAVVAGLGMTAGPAAAYGTYSHGTATACNQCHTVDTATPPTNAACVTCHTGYAVPSSSYTCYTCHTPGQNVQPIKTGAPTSCTDECHLANGTTHQHNPHPERGTCTTCHNVTTNATTPNGSPHHVAAVVVPVATKLTIKVAPTAIKLHKTVKTTGVATPAATLKGKKVALRIDFKKGTKWVKVTTKSVTVTTTGGYSLTYKPGKKGTFRVTASIAKAATYKAYTTKALTFKVK
jgi:hypothetical protein